MLAWLCLLYLCRTLVELTNQLVSFDAWRWWCQLLMSSGDDDDDGTVFHVENCSFTKKTNRRRWWCNHAIILGWTTASLTSLRSVKEDMPLIMQTLIQFRQGSVIYRDQFVNQVVSMFILTCKGFRTDSLLPLLDSRGSVVWRWLSRKR